MGCGDSKSVATVDGHENHFGLPSGVLHRLAPHSMSFLQFLRKSKPKPQVNSHNQIGEIVSAREWFDRVLISPAIDGTKSYHQSAIPDHYVKEDFKFANETVDNSVWERQVSVRSGQPNAGGNSKERWRFIPGHVCKPANNLHNTLHREIEIEARSQKSDVVVIGGLYLGGSSAPTNCDSLLKQIDVQSTHTIVILGNLFDTVSISNFHELPNEMAQIEQKIAEHTAALNVLRNLAAKANVYYLRGTIDADLPRATAERLVGNDIIHVQERNLLLTIKSGANSYQIQCCPGAEWDIFNFHQLDTNQLINGKPIGYYLCRAASQNPKFSVTQSIKRLTDSLPSELYSDFMMQISKQPLQERISQSLLMSALQVNQLDQIRDYKCIVGQGKYISTETLLEYPYFKYLTQKISHEHLMMMLYAMAGDVSLVGRQVTADVLVSGTLSAGLSDVASIGRTLNGNGQDIITVNTGACCQKADKPKLVKIKIPRQGMNGAIELIDAEDPSSSRTSVYGSVNNTRKSEDNMSIESLE